MQELEVITRPEAAEAALDPLRARLLAELREPRSAAGLAERVGLSRQKVNYHLGRLERHGLVRTVGTRSWGGLTERLLEASAAGYVVSAEALGDAAGDPIRTADRLSVAYVIALASRMVRELGAMASTAARRKQRIPVYGLDTSIRFRSPAERAAFFEELTEQITRLIGRFHDEQVEEGRWHRLVLAAHPLPKGAPPREEQP